MPALAASINEAGDRIARRQSFRLMLLLSAIAGSTDAIGFMGLDGLFTSHVTGNVVILVSHLVTSGSAGIAKMLSVPVFMVVVCMAQLLSIALKRARTAARTLLFLQFAFILAFLLISFFLGRTFDADALWPVLAGMCGVAAMAIQNVFIHAALPNSPSTVVLTTNVAKFSIAAMEAMAGASADRRPAREHAAATFPPIVGFVTGCAVGGCLAWQIGLMALVLPAVLALAAVLMRMTPE